MRVDLNPHKFIIKELPMKNIKIALLIALFAISTSTFATGSKQVPPMVEKTIYETIVDFITS
ncbi:MAG: hypothetical protein ACI9LM_001370 [Alteromonadaceae bacterium]|jgi:hypothetical protein